jgi:peroxiredoxin
MKPMAKTMTGLIAAVLLFTISQPQSVDAQSAAAVCDANGKVANLDFIVKDMNGKDVALNAYKGQVVLLDFWATWCPPCRKEIPGFVELYNTYRSKGFIVLGVSMDDTLSDVKKFVKNFKMNYPVLIGHEREDLQLAFAPMPGFPTSFVIGRDGKICSRHTGFVAKEQFERRIKALLSSN